MPAKPSPAKSFGPTAVGSVERAAVPADGLDQRLSPREQLSDDRSGSSHTLIGADAVRVTPIEVSECFR